MIGASGWKLARAYLARLEVSDWLLVLLVAAVIIFLKVNAWSWGSNVIFSHQSPQYLDSFCVAALGGGYLLGRLFQYRRSTEPAALKSLWRSLFGSVSFIFLFLALPAATYYTRLAIEVNPTNGLLAGLGSIGLITALGLIGTALAWWKNLWGLFIGLTFIFLLVWLPNPAQIVETGLSSGNSLAGLLLAVGLLGLVVTLIELLQTQLTGTQLHRYWGLAAWRTSWPSYTGSGALIISGKLTLLRDRFFWVMLVAVIMWQVVLARSFGSATNEWRLIAEIILPATVVAGYISTALDQLAMRLTTAHAHWPILPQLVRLAMFLAGLVGSVLVITAVDVYLFKLSLSASGWLIGLIIGAYAVSGLIGPNTSSASGQFAKIWLIIYKCLAFGLTALFLANLAGTNLLDVSLSLLTITFFALGYHRAADSVTI